jgi:hypothetical protein
MANWSRKHLTVDQVIAEGCDFPSNAELVLCSEELNLVWRSPVPHNRTSSICCSINREICYELWPFENDLASYQLLFFLLRFDDLIVVESGVKVWLKDLKIYRGIILQSLKVDSIKDYLTRL